MRLARGKHAPRHLHSVTLIATVCTAAALAIVMLASTAQGAARLAARLAAAASTLTRQAPDAPPSLRDGRFFIGVPAVGALFFLSNGKPASHFCTGSVVDSPARDVVITAAHCLSGVQPGQIAFVPGYHDGLQPYGIWQVTRIFVDQAWTATQSPDDDVAFLVVHRSGSPTPIQDVTGGERLGVSWGASHQVRVIGYPGDQQRPVTCQAETRPFGTGQMEFDCSGYSDGTSGAPFLADFSPDSGEGTIIGVIGGFQQGGDTAAVSYAARFGPSMRALYQQAIAQG